MINSNLCKGLAFLVFFLPQASNGKPATLLVDAFIKSYIDIESPPSTLTIEARQGNHIIKVWRHDIPITYDSKKAKRKCERTEITIDDEIPLELTYSGNVANLKIEPTPYKDTPLQDLNDVNHIQLTIFIPKPAKDAIVTETYVETNNWEY